jgi:TetR/AcrR family transcriptional regulator
MSVRVVNQRQQQREETRSIILDAAIRRFAANGFDGATLVAIAADCGIRVPLILYHYGSKEDLWRAAVGEIYRRYEGAIAERMPPLDTARDRAWFADALRAQLRALVEHPEYMRILFQEGTEESERLRWLVETHQSRVSGQMMALLAEAQQCRLFPEMDLVHAKFVVSGAASLAITLAPEYRLFSDDDPQSETFLDAHVDVLMRLLMPER